jgi:hypothetical protein
MTEGWRQLLNEELHNLGSSPSIIRMIKSRKMRLAGHVTRMGETGNAYRIATGGKARRKETPRKIKM